MRKTLLFLLSLALPLAAAQTETGAGAQAAPWLNLPTDARSSGLGGAGSALAGDLGSAAANPAALARQRGQRIAFMHHALPLGSAMEHLAYGFEAGAGLGLAASFDYMNFGAMDRLQVDASGRLVRVGTFTPYGMQGALQAGYGLGATAAGLSLKYVAQDLAGASSSTFAADLGAQWQAPSSGVGLGLALLNLGGQLDGASLPLSLRAGSVYRFDLGTDNGALLALDADIPTAAASSTSLSLGAECSIQERYALRGGYRLIGDGGAGGLSLGAGLGFGAFGLDYAFITAGLLGSTQQISAWARF